MLQRRQADGFRAVVVALDNGVAPKHRENAGAESAGALAKQHGHVVDEAGILRVDLHAGVELDSAGLDLVPFRLVGRNHVDDPGRVLRVERHRVQAGFFGECRGCGERHGAERQDGRRVAVCLNAYRHWFTPDCLVLQELGRCAARFGSRIATAQKKNPAGGPAGLLVRRNAQITTWSFCSG